MANNKIKRSIAMLLVLNMLTGMLPVQALADEGNTEAPEIVVTITPSESSSSSEKKESAPAAEEKSEAAPAAEEKSETKTEAAPAAEEKSETEAAPAAEEKSEPASNEATESASNEETVVETVVEETASYDDETTGEPEAQSETEQFEGKKPNVGYDSELTFGEDIGGTVTETTETEIDAEDNETVTETTKIETEGKLEDGSTVKGEETFVASETTNADGEVIGSYTDVIGTETTESVIEDEGSEKGQPDVTVDLIPGEKTEANTTTTTVTGDEPEGEDDANYDYTVTVEADRTVAAETSEIEVTVNKVESDLEALQSELKFDRNDKKDQAAAKKETDLYTDNGHFTDPESIIVTDAPDDAPFKFVGNGDYSGHYVSHIRVIYAKDENGNPIQDENGEYVIDHLEHANGTVLTSGGVPTTDINGPFDQTTGTRPQQFLLKNENGDTVYAYCIDLETGAEEDYWYSVANLEDNDYYATEDAEDHVRAIVTNGYWGTSNEPDEDGNYQTGSLAKLKEDLKKAVADGTVDKEYDITFTTRKKMKEGYELQEGEYIIGSYVYKQITEHVVLTDEVIDAFTEGEALDATQSAIWSYANGSNYALDGEDGMIVGDITYASCAMGDSVNGQNDFAGAARTKAFYEYLMQLTDENESTTVINEKNFVEDLTLTVKDKAEDNERNEDDDKDNDVYDVEMNFTLAFVPDPESDDLLVHLTDDKGNAITDKDGNPIIKRLAGKNSEGREAETILPDEEGAYTLTGIQLGENEDFTFDLRLEGTQYLENGVYIYTAQGGYDKSQTMVGVAEGTNTVDVSTKVTIKFDVDEDNHVVATRKWRTDKDPRRTEDTPPPPAQYRMTRGVGQLETIIDEEVPLAEVPQTGDISAVWFALILMSVCGLWVLNMSDKKCKA